MRRFEPVVALGGALLFGSLFITWYSATGSQEFPVHGSSAFDVLGTSGWQTFTGVDLVLAVLAVVIVVFSADRGGMAAGVVAAAVVVFRMIDPPGPDAFAELGPGAWFALVGALTAVVDVLLALLAAVAVAVPVVARMADDPAEPIRTAVLAAALGPIAIALVVFRLVDTPPPFGDLQLRPGAWLALAGSLIAWTGGWMAMREARRPASPVAAA
jgi:hypothetical protein